MSDLKPHRNLLCNSPQAFSFVPFVLYGAALFSRDIARAAESAAA